MAGTAYFILTRALLALHEADSPLAVALGEDLKGKMSLAIWHPRMACALYVLVAIIWQVPDMRFERALHGSQS